MSHILLALQRADRGAAPLPAEPAAACPRGPCIIVRPMLFTGSPETPTSIMQDVKASWEALLWSPRGIINVIKGFQLNLAAALISPANASEVFPEAPRPLVSSSLEGSYIHSHLFLSSLKKRRARHWGQALCPGTG